MESGGWTDAEATAAMVQDKNSKLECRTDLTVLREELLAADLIERVSQLASLSADANSSVLNSKIPASPPVFTFRAPQLEHPLFLDNSQNDFAFNEFKLSFNNALQATPNMTSSKKFIFLRSLLRGRALSLLQQCVCTEDGDPFSTAWELLEGEFLRKEVLISSFLDKIFNYPILKTLDDINFF